MVDKKFISMIRKLGSLWEDSELSDEEYVIFVKALIKCAEEK